MTSETHDAETLLPCPFCGGSAVQFDALKGHKVECENRNTNCPVNMRSRYQISSTDAANLWNTRALPVQKNDAETVERVRLAIIDASLTVNREARDMDHARALGALSAMPDIIRAMVVPLVFIRHPIGWNCTGFMIDTRGSCGGVYVMRGLYGKPRFDSVEDAITACNAHNAAQIMAGLGL